jgi:hypothetical protein
MYERLAGIEVLINKASLSGSSILLSEYDPGDYDFADITEEFPKIFSGTSIKAVPVVRTT